MITDEEQKDLDKFAYGIHALYKSLYTAGFNSDQAFKLTIASVRRASDK